MGGKESGVQPIRIKLRASVTRSRLKAGREAEGKMRAGHRGSFFTFAPNNVFLQTILLLLLILRQHTKIKSFLKL